MGFGFWGLGFGFRVLGLTQPIIAIPLNNSLSTIQVLRIRSLGMLSLNLSLVALQLRIIQLLEFEKES